MNRGGLVLSAVTGFFFGWAIIGSCFLFCGGEPSAPGFSVVAGRPSFQAGALARKSDAGRAVILGKEVDILDDRDMPDALSSAFADNGGHVPVRLSGLLEDRPDPKEAVGAYFFATDRGVVYKSTGAEWMIRDALGKDDCSGHKFGLEADLPDAADMIGWIYHATDTAANYEAFPSKKDDGAWYLAPMANPFTPPGIAPDSLSKLRSSLSNQFGCAFQSAGDNPSPEGPYILVQTLGASLTNPYLVRMEQFILEAFDGGGQLDLVERDAVRRVTDGVADGTDIITSVTFGWQEGDEGKTLKVKVDGGTPRWLKILDVPGSGTVQLDGDVEAGSNLILSMDGEDEVTLATKTGFTADDAVQPKNPNTVGACSSFSKPITSNKIYKVVFARGHTAGHGGFSLNVTKFGK